MDEPTPAMPPAAEPPKPLLARVFGATRYIMALAVLGIFVGSVALLLSGAFDIFAAVWHQLTDAAGGASVAGANRGDLRLHMIEAVDTILVATVLFVIAAGLYQLFVHPALNLPPWMQTDSVDDLELRLAGMVVTILSVIFLTAALEWEGEGGLLGFGLAVASVIAAVALFLYQESRHHRGRGE